MLMTTEMSGRHAVPVDEPVEAEVPERARRRVFSAQYKLRILAEYERRDRDSRSALLRREGLYTSSISEWQLGHCMVDAVPWRPPWASIPRVAAHKAGGVP